ncbi:MAG: phosphopantetheine-binding protein [Helicobacteraceae bacterium]|nr:phosphopantetheine-binding protein [Helicobacteraceae bacterium]
MITTEKLKTELIALFNLEGVLAEEISDDDHLFHDGLGLDSVDAIELTIFLDNAYGIIFPNISESEKVFTSIKTLQEYINMNGITDV